jgi:hypothetical protein
LILIWVLDRVEHVGGGELDAVAPIDAASQLHGHFGEIGIVDGLLGGERILPDAIDAFLGIDVPEGVHPQLVEAGRLAAGVDRSYVEPASVPAADAVLIHHVERETWPSSTSTYQLRPQRAQ